MEAAMSDLFIIGTVVLLVAGVAAFKAITKLICIAGPNEVLVFSGPRAQIGTEEVGYVSVRGGRRIRVPLLEKVSRLDLTNMIIDVSVTGAYSAGGIPLNVQAVANVKIGGEGVVLHNALSRLLGKSRPEIMKMAKETLEGNLRGVLATLTPEQVNEDKVAFAHSLLEEAEHDLTTLGLMLDTLSIQNVTDDQGYLQSIGRKQSAELQKRARVAEAQARAQAMITAATNERQTAEAQIDAAEQVARANAERRIVDAETMRAAVVAEQESEVAALVARAEADCAVQNARIEQVRRQLNAEMIEPARAERDASLARATGAAQRIIEDGRAQAESLRDLTRIWVLHGPQAKRVLMLQKLDGIAELLTGRMSKLSVDTLTVIDGRGETSGALTAARAVEEIRATTGIDVPAIAKRYSGQS
jgi:flotillin